MTAEERARLLRKKYGTISYGGGAGGAGQTESSGWGKVLWPALGIGAGALGAYGLYHGLKGLGYWDNIQDYAKKNFPSWMYNTLESAGGALSDTTDYMQNTVVPTVGTVLKKTAEQVGPAIANTAKSAGNAIQQTFAPIANPTPVVGPDGQAQTNQGSFASSLGAVANGIGGLYNSGKNFVNSTIQAGKDMYNTATGGEPTAAPAPGQVNAQVIPNAQTNAPATPLQQPGGDTSQIMNPNPAQKLVAPKAYGGQVPRYADGHWEPGYMGRMMKANNYAIPKEISGLLAGVGGGTAGYYVNKRGSLLNQILGKGAMGLGYGGAALNFFDIINQMRQAANVENEFARFTAQNRKKGVDEELVPDEIAEQKLLEQQGGAPAATSPTVDPEALLDAIGATNHDATVPVPQAYGGSVPRYASGGYVPAAADGIFSKLAGRAFKALGNYFSPDTGSSQDAQSQPQTQQSANVNQASSPQWPSQTSPSVYSQNPQAGAPQAFKRSTDGQQGLAAHSQYQGNTGQQNSLVNNNMGQNQGQGQRPYQPTMLDQGLNAASYITGHPTLAPVVGGALRGIADVMAPQGGTTPSPTPAPVANQSTNIPIGGAQAQTAPAMNPANGGFFANAGHAAGSLASIPAFMSPFGLLAGGAMIAGGLNNPVASIGQYAGSKLDEGYDAAKPYLSSAWDTAKDWGSSAWNGFKNWWNTPTPQNNNLPTIQGYGTGVMPGSINPTPMPTMQPQGTHAKSDAYGGQVPRYDSGGWPDRQYRKTSRAMVGALGGGALGVLGGNLYGYKDLREKLANNYDYYDKQALERRGGEWFTPMSTMAPIGALLGGGIGYNS